MTPLACHCKSECANKQGMSDCVSFKEKKAQSRGFLVTERYAFVIKPASLRLRSLCSIGSSETFVYSFCVYQGHTDISLRSTDISPQPCISTEKVWLHQLSFWVRVLLLVISKWTIDTWNKWTLSLCAKPVEMCTARVRPTWPWSWLESS